MTGHTPGPWVSVIDDTGGQWSGWPLCVCPVGDDDRSVVRTGGQWPYEWDAYTSQAEAVANARLIAASPDMFHALRLVRASTEWACMESSTQDAVNAAIKKAQL